MIKNQLITNCQLGYFVVGCCHCIVQNWDYTSNNILYNYNMIFLFSCAAMNIIPTLVLLCLPVLCCLSGLLPNHDWNESSAFKDSRFKPVSKHELSQLQCSVSLLRHFEPIVNCMDWEVRIIRTKRTPVLILYGSVLFCFSLFHLFIFLNKYFFGAVHSKTVVSHL